VGYNCPLVRFYFDPIAIEFKNSLSYSLLITSLQNFSHLIYPNEHKERVMAVKNCYLSNVVAFLIICFALTTDASPLSGQKTTAVQLATVYTNQNIQEYLISEKFDGVRAVWRNKQLRTRSGNLIHAPRWFVKNLPDVWLDGELRSERGHFEDVVSTVTKDKPVDSEWEKIKFMVFDAPNYESTFQTRSQFYTELIQKLQIKHLKATEQFVVTNNKKLIRLLENYTQNGAEGLMLHRANAMFVNGRSSNILKLKKFMDAEARVVAHLPGKGKYDSLMGSIMVEYDSSDGQLLSFKIGTGFSDQEREHPPAIGSIVTFQYHGYTKRGVPRFASFMRVRKEH